MAPRGDRNERRPDPADHLRLVAEYSTDVLFHVDLAGVLEWASPSAERLLGWPPSALIGRSMRELLVHDDRSLVGPVVDRLRSGAGSTFEARMETAGGGARWVSASIAPILGDDGLLVGGVGSVRDIDAEMARLVAQRVVDERVRASFDSLHDPHVVLEPVRDVDGEIVDFVHVHANDAACADNGRTREELLGARLLDVVPDPMGSTLMALYRRVIDTGQPLVLDDFAVVDPRHGGEERRFDVRAARVGDALSHTWRDVTERHRALADLLDRATHDALTGLANRSTVSDELERALSAARAQGHSVAVLLVDVDHFKQVNDTFGHAAGDELLRITAGRLGVCTRHGDLVARLGGDEFLVVMPKVDDEWEASSAAERLVTHFRTPIELRGRRLRLSLSVGIALATGSEPPDEVLRRADVALYEAKEAGRDRAVLFDALHETACRSADPVRECLDGRSIGYARRSTDIAKEGTHVVRRRTRAERPTHPTKQLLIDTVLQLLQTVPVEQLTCDEVLHASGVSRGSLYHHFEDYPDLIEHALAARFAASVDASIRAFATAVQESTSAADFKAKVLAFSRDTQSRDRQANRLDRVVAFASAANSPRFRAVLSEQQQRLTDAQADAIVEAQRRGWVRPELDAHAVAVFVQAYTLGRVLDDMSVHPLEPEAWAMLIDEVLERTFFVSTSA